MKVGIYCSYTPPTEGGGFTFQDTILNTLAKVESKHEFYIFYHGQAKAISNSKLRYVKLEKNGLTILQKLQRIGLLAYHQFFLETNLDKPKSSLNKALQQYNIDLCWFIKPHHELVDIPFITTVWDLQHRLQPFFPEVSVTGWTWLQREQFYSQTLPRATYVFTGTQTGKCELQQFYGIPDERIQLLLHPTPQFALDYDGHPIDFPHKLPQQYLFYPAQFWPHKNHLTLLHALKLLRETHNQDIGLVLTGSDGGNLAFIKQQVKTLKLEKQVYCLGFVTTEELIFLYQHALALTYITFFGPENLPPLEAMALGCPVVASNVNGADEQLGEAALYVDPKSETDIAQTVLKLIKAPNLRKEFIKKGRARAQAWTTEGYINKVNQVVDEFSAYRRTWTNETVYVGK